MKTQLTSILSVIIMLVSVLNSPAQDDQRKIKVKIVENEKVIVDTTLLRSGSEMEGELDQLLRERDLIILRSGDQAKEGPVWADRDFYIFRTDEMDSLLHSIQDRMTGFRMQMEESEEWKEWKEQLKKSMSSTRQELDSFQKQMMRTFDRISPPRAYFFGKDDDSRMIVITTPEEKNDSLDGKSFKYEWRAGDQSSGEQNRERKMIVIRSDDREPVIELEGLKVVILDQDPERTERDEQGRVEITLRDGRILKLEITDPTQPKKQENKKEMKKGKSR